MTLFNSLGSNYSKPQVLLALKLLISPTSWFDAGPKKTLTKTIAKEFNGQALLTNQGRQAITLALKLFGISKGDLVITQAFTCYAVEEAIINSGAKPIFVDTPKNQLNITTHAIQKTYTKNPNSKAVIIQHTLGFANNELEKIASFCQKNKLFLIEDLAHSYGAKTQAGTRTGAKADAIVFSFGRDKILDAVSGGALVISHDINTPPLPLAKTSIRETLKDLLYPPVTTLIRQTYSVFAGKIIHLFLKKIGLLSSSVTSRHSHVQSPSNQISSLAANAYKLHSQAISHRQKISKIYQTNLKPSIQIPNLNLKLAACLRYPALVSNRNHIISALQVSGIYISDTWYKKPVDTGSTKLSSVYKKGSCPNAQQLSRHIINLPTHLHVSESDAKKISKLINQLT